MLIKWLRILISIIILTCGCSLQTDCPEEMAEMVINGKKICIDKFENYIVAYKSNGKIYKYTPQTVGVKIKNGKYVPGNIFEENELKDKIYARSAKGIIPVDNVSWIEADIACRNSHKRLCKREEWEYACKDGKDQEYPYGKEYQGLTCNSYENGTKRGMVSVMPSGYMSDCKNSKGVFDLSGNLWEWLYDSDQTGTLRLIKGGGFANSGYDEGELSCSKNKYQPPNVRLSGVGFRCCKDK